ncbi:MAG: hypothetical protein LBQ48_05270 [Oscillospiraceae bacterium]|nr:hypothetical protein [Oscillospiraceae bacterium]
MKSALEVTLPSPREAVLSFWETQVLPLIAAVPVLKIGASAFSFTISKFIF